MRKSQQQASRKQAIKLNRLAALNRKRRRWWRVTVVQQLQGPNTKANRRARMGQLRVMPIFRTAPARARREPRQVRVKWLGNRKV